MNTDLFNSCWNDVQFAGLIALEASALECVVVVGAVVGAML